MDSKLKYLLSFLTLLFVVIAWALFSLPDSKLHLIFCDVGQGDAILVIKGSTQVLIDGGPNDKVLGCLSKHIPFWDRQIEMVISTHPDADHLTGLVSVIDRYNVSQILANSLVTDTGVFSKFRSEVISKKIPVFSPKSGDKIKVSSLILRVLFPQNKLGDEIVWKNPQDLKVLGISAYTGEINATMLVFELEYGNFKALLTGDISSTEEKKIGDIGGIGEIGVLKIAHHGSKYSTSQEFLDLIRPKLAVISVGASNNYGHPTSEVLDRLKTIGVKILRTDIDGEVEVVSDGVNWKLENGRYKIDPENGR
jgi:competence protein ComEC